MACQRMLTAELVYACVAQGLPYPRKHYALACEREWGGNQTPAKGRAATRFR